MEVDKYGNPLVPQPNRVLFEGGELTVGNKVKKLEPLEIAKDKDLWMKNMPGIREPTL